MKDYYEDLEADSIDNWTRTKMVALKLVNQKINFLTFDEWAIRYNEVFAQAVPIGNGYFSDIGHRFRYNDFAR
jgi:hypothetical protein